MIESDYKKLTTPKSSEYNIYRKLTYQEQINPKNKFDNRLYFSLRYKNYNYTSTPMDQIFHNNRIKGLLELNYPLFRRFEIFEESMSWGSNKYGVKKIYKLERFFVPPKNSVMLFMFVVGINISYFLLAMHYKKIEHDVWMRNYGDFFPMYAKIGEYTYRSISILEIYILLIF